MGNLLIEMYGKCGYLEDSRAIFNKMPTRNVFSWNIIISLYAHNDSGKEALNLFTVMLQLGTQPDICTFSSVVYATLVLKSLTDAKLIHHTTLHESVEIDTHLASVLMNMYGQYSSLEDARAIFDPLSHKDDVSWNSIITVYSMHGHDCEVLQLFQKMPNHKANYGRIAVLCVVNACCNQKGLQNGNLIHALAVEDGYHADMCISTALLSMYSNCGSLKDAEGVFARIMHHDLISLSAMIAVNTLHGNDKEAFSLFSQMHQEGLKPDKVTLVSIISTCADQTALTKGQLIHASVTEYGLDSDVLSGNALVNMYGKCGSLLDTKYVFNNMSMRNVLSWTAMIEVQAYFGFAAESFELFYKMQEQNVTPNDVTFLNVLCSCSHTGLIDEGCFFFMSMILDSEVEVTPEHCASLIDLFGRAGRLAEAELVICEMSLEPNAVIWETLLSACKMHNDFSRAMIAAQRAISLNSKSFSTIRCVAGGGHEIDHWSYES
ncbi:hypothetical protein KP509_1Z131300 [Ceratopteris richardii]|nr:hypothetical protein KP509_1Z131300 [Ceratopteris richardii]